MRKAIVRSAVGVGLAVAASAALLPSWSAGASQARTVDDTTVDSFGRIAQTVLSERTAALVDDPRAAERIAGPKAGRNVRVSAGLTRSEDTAVSSLRSRKKLLAKLGEAYSAARTEVAVDNTKVKDGRATVEVTETTTFTYKRVKGDEPSTTGFKARHELSFTSGKGGKWELTGIRSTDNGLRAVNAPVAKSVASAGTTPNAARAATSWPARAVPKRQTTSGYDYAAMAAYAEKYWRNYNPSYRKFNADGGDCTNFISQALKAGGWKNESGPASDYRKWWYDSKTQSDSWVGANEWSWYALNSKRVTTLSNVYQLEVGDILQMDFDRDGSKDHSMITTYRSRMGVPYLTYHSTNTYRKSVASIVASYPDAVYYAYRT
ncbi:amidase domain-containing protein [Streptomyces griseocarneus]|uniref:amidase domain-containing protein n=1 Tax=Streptomyces griseocarneus TaxID=51201 RepID=UPI001CCF3C13|nr:amidase domain-containing protein [Streptomyces griseocarneus]MBZ6477163.1 amidase domain-containing protein [Streptomyces griseocarneus]